MRNIFIIITALLALASCDIVDFDVDYGEFPECEMQLDKDQVYVMVGDSFKLAPIFTPDTLPNREVYYYSEPDSILSYDTEYFHALYEGTAALYAISVQQRLRDTCMVHIMKPWVMEVNEYPYDMVIYARVTLDDAPIDTTSMTVAAFVGKECRGVGVMRRAFGIDYMELRIGSELGSMWIDDEEDEDGPVESDRERVTIKLYDKAEQMVHVFHKSIELDEETHGTLSDLFELDF